MLSVVVAFKGAPAAKSRLTGALSPDQRTALAQKMLQHVVGEASAAERVARVFVVAPGDAVAVPAGAEMIDEGRALGLDNAAAHAVQHLLARGERHMLLLPADLPLVRSSDIDALVAAHGAGNADVIVPAADGEGTNALLVGLPPRFAFSFGPGSFARHRAAAQAAGSALVVHRCARLGTDIDDPADLARLPADFVG